jgi:hypothetical protein
MFIDSVLTDGIEFERFGGWLRWRLPEQIVDQRPPPRILDLPSLIQQRRVNLVVLDLPFTL